MTRFNLHGVIDLHRDNFIIFFQLTLNEAAGPVPELPQSSSSVLVLSSSKKRQIKLRLADIDLDYNVKASWRSRE